MPVGAGHLARARPARWERAFDAMAAGPHAEEWPEFDLCGIPKRAPGQG
jgi:hypothetical protein